METVKSTHGVTGVELSSASNAIVVRGQLTGDFVPILALKDTGEGVTCSEGSSGYVLVDNAHFQWLVQEQSKRAAKSNMPSKDAAEAINCLKDILKRLPDGLNDDENEFVDDICEWWDHRKKAVRRGWRAFKCGRRPCQFVWAEPTAGHDWLDVVRCPNCMTTPCEPVRSWPDSELKVDEHGNLVNGGL